MADDPHPADDARATSALVRALRGHVDTLASSMGDDVPPARRVPVAAAWAYTSALVAWAADHQLVHPWLRSAADYVPDGPWAMRQWLACACRSLAAHPATAQLANPWWNPMWEGAPGEDACRSLVAWWAKDAPCLAHPDAGRGPASITGWLVGDLLQHVSDQRRKGNALVQAPWWVVDLILDRTLIPAARQHIDEAITTIDPCCGTGHFLIRTVDYLWELYTTGSLAPRQALRGHRVDGWTPVGPAEAVRRILDGVTGVELDPLTAVTARLRVVVTIGDLMRRSGLVDGPLRLDTIPRSVRPRVAVGDSLLSYADPGHWGLHPHVAAIYGRAGADAPTPTQPSLLKEVA